MEKRKFTNEHLLYLIAFVCALVMRLANLGEIPLSESEASWALQAYEVSQGEAAAISGQPAYVLLTGTIFAIFSSSDTLARLLPALVGSMIVWLPFALRYRLGKMSCLVFAFGLALDPGLVAVSRIAGGPMLAFGFGVLAAAAWLLEAPVTAGILGGLALMSGPPILTGLVGLAVAWALWSSTRKENLALPALPLRRAAIAGGITILLAGTLFMRHPQGLSAMVAAIPDYFGGWFQAGATPLSQVYLALLVYQPLAVVFGIIAMVRKSTWNNRTTQLLSFWFVAALVLTSAYPSRQVSDLIWVLVPLWGLAGYELARHLRPTSQETQTVAWGQATLIIVFMVFFWLNLSNLSALGSVTIPQDFNLLDINDIDPIIRQNILRVVMVIVVPIFAALSVTLVGIGWSYEEAGRGTVWGTLIILGLYITGTAWSAGHPRNQAANELWTPSPAPGYSNLLRETLGDLSVMKTGTPDSIEVVYQSDSASLVWVLRDMTEARFATQLPPGELPQVIINTQFTIEDSIRSSAYRGQSFAWQTYRNWGGALPPDFDRWLLYREAPTYFESIVLWARADIFPEGSLLPSPGGQPEQEEEPDVEEELFIPEH